MPQLNTDILYGRLTLERRAWYTGWPKKVSHYQLSSLNRIEIRHYG